MLSKEARKFYCKLKKLIGTSPNKIAYYKNAFTHRSASRNKKGFQHNERLEYLGDAMLGAIVADYLYKKFPSKEEGDLTKMRSNLVSRAVLSQVGRDMKLEEFLIADISSKTESKYVLSNMVEALVGAVYLDLGYTYTKRFVLDILFKDLLANDIEAIENDFKSKMLEWGQKRKKSISFTSEHLPIENIFKANIIVNGIPAGTGVGHTKKEAEQNAAKSVWISRTNFEEKMI